MNEVKMYRALALESAVKHAEVAYEKAIYKPSTEDIIKIAQRFERYISTGE